MTSIDEVYEVANKWMVEQDVNNWFAETESYLTNFIVGYQIENNLETESERRKRVQGEK